MSTLSAMFASERRVAPVTFGAPSRATASWRPATARIDAPTVAVCDDRELREAERLAERAAEIAAAFEQGQAEGLASAAGEVAALRQSLASALGSIETHVAALTSASRTEAVALAVAIARAVVAVELKTNPETLHAIVERALAAVPRTDEVVLRCHPDDQEAMAALVPEALRHCGYSKQGEPVSIRVAQSREIERGGCILDFEEGSVDAQPSAALEVVIAAIHETLGGDA